MTSRIAVEATRVAAGDDRIGYDGPEQTFHWLTAILVVSLWTLGETWGFVPRGSSLRAGMILTHVSLGILLAAVLALRILWRIGPGRRVLPLTTGLVEMASQAVHYLLYALLVAETALGVNYRWSQGHPLGFFHVFAIPPLLDLHAHRRLIGELHNWTAQAILVLAGLHAAAALFHHYVLRDDVLVRMLPGRAARRAEAESPDPRTAAGRSA